MSERKRKKWTAAEKLRIVLTSMQPGVEVSELCRREGINPTQFYEWKKRFRHPEPASFVAVEVSKAEVTPPQTKQISGIEMRHRRGWSLIVDPGFDAGHLRRLLSVLELES